MIVWQSGFGQSVIMSNIQVQTNNTYYYNTTKIINGIVYKLQYQVTPSFGKENDLSWLQTNHKDALNGKYLSTQ